MLMHHEFHAFYSISTVPFTYAPISSFSPVLFLTSMLVITYTCCFSGNCCYLLGLCFKIGVLSDHRILIDSVPNTIKIRRFKPPPKQQDRRRNGILFRTPSFVSTPDSFFPANWPPLQQASQLFPVRVLYYIIFVNCNIIKYTL